MKKTQQLDWMIEDYDDHDNTIWCAVGGSTDGESGDLFYRLKLEAWRHRCYWVEASSPELMHDEKEPRKWLSLEAAKNTMQKDFDEAMEATNPKASQ